MMAARPLSSGFNFQSVADKLTAPKAREELGRLMKARGELNKIMSAESSKPVDFEHYRKVLQTEGLVDAFEKSLQSVQYPEFEEDLLSKMDAAFSSLLSDAASVTQKSQARVEELQSLLTTLRGRKDISEVTVDEALQQDPKLAAEIEKEIDDEKWGISEGDSKGKKD